MTAKEIFKILAPYNIKWTDWVKPISFIELDNKREIKEIIDYTIPKINYLNKLEPNTAIILDTNGQNSIKEGISLAKLGYRPIPIFNGTNPKGNTKSTTNNYILEPLLIWGAKQLQSIPLQLDAPPVFLLDSNRLNRYKSNITIFDNSWDIYHQDLPTPQYFLKNNINRIIIKGEKLNNDLSKILYKHQVNNIEILFTNGYDEPKIIKLKKPKKEEF